MIQRDYILRLISDLAEMVAKLIKRDNNEITVSFNMASSKIETIYGCSFNEFLNYTDEQLFLDEWSETSCIGDSVADLLIVMAKMSLQMQLYQQHENLMLKALYLLNRAESLDRAYKFDRVVAISQIKEALGVD